MIKKEIYEILARDLILELIADQVYKPAKDHIIFIKNNKKYRLEIKEQNNES